MFARLATGWALAKQSFRVLKMDKELLLFPVFSGIACLLVLASFAVPLFASGQFNALFDDQGFEKPVFWALMFAFYLVNYFVIVFFNSALIACAIIRFKGGDPTLGDGFRAASSRLPQIFGWALVSATVGILLKLIESRSEKVGQFVAGLLGMAWSIVTYFVVPVLVVERLGPVDAVKRSTAILRKTWGEALGGKAGIGLVVFLCFLVAAVPAILGLALGAMTNSIAVVVAGVIISVILFLIVALVSATLESIVCGALYLYAAEGTVPNQFDNGLMQEAFNKKTE
jgi:hypothetical protein